MLKEPARENFFMRHATKVAIGAVTLLMLLAAAIFYRQGESAHLAKSWLVHTYETKEHIELLFGKLRDAELGERGYLITGDEDYLEPYHEALKIYTNAITLPKTHFDTARLNTAIEPNNLPEEVLSNQHISVSQELEIIRWLTLDNVAQQRNLDELDDVVKELLKHWSDAIKTRSDHSATAVRQETQSHRGKQLMDHVRILIRVMNAEESRLLDIRTEADRESTRQSELATYLGIALFYVAMALSIWFYQRNRARAAAQMLRYTQELEKSEEELKMQQEELKASNEEIEASNEELEEKTHALEEQNQRIRRQTEELKESQRLIEEKAGELERVSKYKSEFLANMSHELRTPLNSLLILARGLAANEEGNLTAEQTEEARVIHNGGLELLSIINDILDLSKVEAGKMSVMPEDIYVGNIVKRMREQFEPVAKDKGVKFHVQLDKTLPETFHTDTQRVEQILKNLLSNAFKFTENGAVALNIHRAGDEAGLQRASFAGMQAVAFEVSDTGIGIEASKFKDIFEAFQQEDGSTDRHYGGTGLGLTIARKFAHLLGGEIHVASTKGEGSTFTLYLPLKFTEGTAQSPSPFHSAAADVLQANIASPPALKVFVPDDRKSISTEDKVLLIIEDDRDFAATLMKIARKRGYKCLAAGDGKSGLLLATEQPVTAVILDLRLPDIDGMCVLDQLKHNLKTRHIPVHIITGLADPDTVVPIRKGAIGYLTKPAAKEEIDGAFARIEGLLRSAVKKVLVVEDDHKTQTAVQSLLKQKNIEIVTVGTGAAAFKALKTTAFDCIILDLRLPDMTGFEWLEAVEKETGQAEAPPIVIYTARELTEDENRELNRHTGSIVIKGASSSERLLDEVTLFLHSVESALSKDQQEMIRMQHDPDRALQNRTVLLVDDDMRNTFALSKLLKKHGLNVVIADNGQMALEKLAAEKAIELVIMDIMMPVMDGYQAMLAIRASQDWKNLPVIALTARAMPEEQERCMAAGANDYLIKPVDIERLLTLLRVWLFRQEKAA